MSRIWVVVLVTVAFVAGVGSSSFIRAASHPFDLNVGCIENGICVGANAPEILNNVNEDEHGLTAIICDNNIAAGTIAIGNVLRGDRCTTNKYFVELRSPTERVVITVQQGKVSAITVGPLHVVDL